MQLNKLYKVKKTVLNKLRGSNFGDSIVTFLKKIGIRKLYIQTVYKQEKKHPTTKMLKSKDYFHKHAKEIKAVEKLFEDKLSVEIFRESIKYRYTHNVKDRPKYSTKDQYFPKDIIKISPDEVFVDCGAFEGDTLKSFLKYSKNKYKNIICFEPDPYSFKKLKAKISNKTITAIPAGTYKENTKHSFTTDLGVGNKLSDSNNGTSTIDVVKIDDVAECKNATFIKMDIEGAEIDSLNGAKETILKNKPKLAICIYHSDSDHIKIPQLIHKMVPEYKLYVRHHSYSIDETVLYAVI